MVTFVGLLSFFFLFFFYTPSIGGSIITGYIADDKSLFIYIQMYRYKIKADVTLSVRCSSLCSWQITGPFITLLGLVSRSYRLCLSITDFHPDTWNPAWSVSTILTGLLSFMVEKGPTLGSIETSDYTVRVLFQ